MPYAGILVFWLAAVAVPAAGAAEQQAAAGGGVPSEFGSETRSWLELQRSGQAAAPERPVSGAVASRTYKRYLKSFDHPLPEFFGRDSAVPSTR